AFFAVPLARVNPRQGRFLKLIPAIILYMAYLALLVSARGWMEAGKTPAAIGLWWVHLVFLAIGVMLNFRALTAPSGPIGGAHAAAWSARRHDCAAQRPDRGAEHRRAGSVVRLYR